MTVGEYIAQNGDNPLWGGWSRRRTYCGHLAALGPVVSSVNAIGTGYPAWESQ